MDLVLLLEGRAGSRWCPRRSARSTNTGWNRRSSAGSFSMCLRYSSSVVAPIARSSPRASMGFSMLPASIAPSAAPAPTMVCSSSMNVMTSPSLSTISFRTAFRRSSNSPRYLEPAIIEPRSSAITRLFLSDSGTSPATMRCASPSTIAVLPTPGSPIRTGLFLVRRESTWMTRRTSSSRPITGSSLPATRLLGEVAAVALQRLVLLLGVLVGDALTPAHLGERRSTPSRVSPASFRIWRAPESTSSSARSRCSVEMYSSVSDSPLPGPPARAPFRWRVYPHVGGLALRVHLRDPVERLIHLVTHRLRRHTDLVQQRVDHTFGIREAAPAAGAPARSSGGGAPRPVGVRPPTRSVT